MKYFFLILALSLTACAPQVHVVAPNLKYAIAPHLDKARDSIQKAQLKVATIADIPLKADLTLRLTDAESEIQAARDEVTIKQKEVDQLTVTANHAMTDRDRYKQDAALVWKWRFFFFALLFLVLALRLLRAYLTSIPVIGVYLASIL